ncbi:MAG: thiamine-monophosphate kinase, partial [Acidobacteriota bacterium]|nr:thiamine-monophosphate kinase [Acidobacteriota bacterium]
MSEAQLVARVRELFSPRIGDDAAVVDGQVLTTDMLVEDVDFTRAIPLRYIGRKSLAVNLSDLAAMGAAPSHALLALGIADWARPGIDELLVAMAGMAKEYGIEIVGGDLSRAEKLTIAVTAIGRVVTRPLLRSGARPGDRIYLSRPVGGSATGLALLQKGWTIDDGPASFGYAERELALSAIRRHVDPEPEVALGQKLAAITEVTACIDVSDGLSTDLHHLCDASGYGAQIECERIPMFPDLMSSAHRLGVRAQEVVLHGGEEYALLFTSSLPESQMSTRVGRPVYAFGRMTREQGVLLLENGASRRLDAGGFDHFTQTPH